jgi:hypothetical protein
MRSRTIGSKSTTSGPALPPELEEELDDLEAAGMAGQTVPLEIAERDRIARNTDPRNKGE